MNLEADSALDLIGGGCTWINVIKNEHYFFIIIIGIHSVFQIK